MSINRLLSLCACSVLSAKLLIRQSGSLNLLAMSKFGLFARFVYAQYRICQNSRERLVQHQAAFMLQLEMGIEPNNEGSGSVWFGCCYSSGSVRVRLILSSGSVRFDQLHSSGSVRVRLMRVSQLRIWFGHGGNCKSLVHWKYPTHVIKNTKPITQTVPHASDKTCDCSQFRISESVHSS